MFRDGSISNLGRRKLSRTNGELKSMLWLSDYGHKMSVTVHLAHQFDWLERQFWVNLGEP